MPHYRVTRHEDWIATVYVFDADDPEDAKLKAESLWADSNSVFNDAVPNSEEVEEVGPNGW